MEYKVLEVWGSGGPSSIPLRPNTDLQPAKQVYVCALENRALQQAKNEINLFYQEGKWDDYKKVTNPYEYIFLSWNRRSSRSVATRQPLSRSYFKMIEMWKRLDLTTELAPFMQPNTGIGLRTAHAAEGPGGFIEACLTMATKNMLSGIHNWGYVGTDAITLRSEAKNVPGWRKAVKFLAYWPQITIQDGEDATGNILTKANQDHFVKWTNIRHPDGVHLYTADGGFDFSSDYNAQEDSIFPLLLAEAIIGLKVLGKGGCMIIKCFDTTEQPTLDLLWLISRAFRSWGISKPHTSRSGNAERYFIGKGYLGPSSDIINMLDAYQAKQQFLFPILAHPVQCDSWKPTMDLIQKLQVEIEQMEIVVIRQTLDLIKTTDPMVIEGLVRENVNRSIEWCKNHDEEITTTWVTEMDKNVAKETQDLLNILNPPPHNVPYSYANWTNRSTLTNTLVFDNFRMGESTTAQTPPVVNPFMRLKTKPAHSNMFGTMASS
jgi:FtsJ-like methyltransferase